MNVIRIYLLIVVVYGLLDIFFQKNSKTILFSKSSDKTYLPILITLILDLTFVPFEFSHFERPIHIFTFWVGILICIVAIFIRIKGQLDLGLGFSTRIEKQVNHHLVTKGLYARIRHPLYLAILLLLVGANLMLSAYYSWIFLIVNVYALKKRIDKEEEFMIKNFSGYSDYIKRTKRIIPFIW